MKDQQSFQVRLGNYRLSKLMPALCEGARVSGTLMVERGHIKRGFTFRDGDLVASSSSSPREHLSQVVADFGLLNVATANTAFATAGAQARPFAQHLLSSGLVPRDRLVEALEHKARESFFDCYTWDSGDLWFVSRREPPQGVEICIDLSTIHREAMARLEEWNELRAQLPGMATTFDVRAEAPPRDASPEEQALLAAAASGKTVQEMLELSCVHTLAVTRRLLDLHRRGVLAARGAPSAARQAEGDGEAHLEEARRAMAAGDFERAMELSLKALRCNSARGAQDVYRSAEVCLATELAKRVAALEGRLSFQPVPLPLPPTLIPYDLYLYSRLKGARSLTEAIRQETTGQVAAAWSLFRLIDSGAIVATI